MELKEAAVQYPCPESHQTWWTRTTEKNRIRNAQPKSTSKARVAVTGRAKSEDRNRSMPRLTRRVSTRRSCCR